MNKSLSVAQYLLSRRKGADDNSISPMQLLKLVYIAHGFMLGWRGMPLLDEPVEAWQYGPVVPSVYHAIKKYRSGPVANVDGADADHAFTNDEKAIMNYVADSYGDINGIALSAATHKPGTPWSQTWQYFDRNAQISNDIIESFYRKIIQEKRHSAL